MTATAREFQQYGITVNAYAPGINVIPLFTNCHADVWVLPGFVTTDLGRVPLYT